MSDPALGVQFRIQLWSFERHNLGAKMSHRRPNILNLIEKMCQIRENVSIGDFKECHGALSSFTGSVPSTCFDKLPCVFAAAHLKLCPDGYNSVLGAECGQTLICFGGGFNPTFVSCPTNTLFNTTTQDCTASEDR